MSADYIISNAVSNSKTFCNYNDEVLVFPKDTLFIPMQGNIRATLKTERNLILTSTKLDHILTRLYPAIFCEENLVLKEKGKYIFETKYVNTLDNVLSINHLNNISPAIQEYFLEKAPKEICDLANKLVGTEKSTIKILYTFYGFVRKHQLPELNTIGKPISVLFNEYATQGYFSGNCKESKTFFSALCNAKSYPTKGVDGKILDEEGHVWTDVFVPAKDGYKLFPVDTALKSFWSHNPENNIIMESIPNNTLGSFSKLLDFMKLKNFSSDYTLKFERIYS